MKRYWGFFVLIQVWYLLGLAPPGCTAPSTSGDSALTGNASRRDLGEKGKIVIESLDLNEADLADVVRLLARISGINIITGDLKGSITVYLENVTVQAALTAILSSQGYGFLYDGNIARIVDAKKLGEDRVETVTETFLLNYLPAQDVADSLRKVFSGSQSGSTASQIEANVEANAIIVVDIPRQMDDIRKLINILDRRFEQVEIEGRFVEISYSQDQEWGIDWKYFQDPSNTFDVNLAPSAVNASDVAGQFKFAVINGRDNLTGFLQALETNNDIRVLADPKILALENKEATIELTDEIPFVEANVSNGVVTESIQFQQTGIRLVVTPQIAEEPNGTFVRMKLELEQRIAGPNVVLQNSTAFPIDSRHAQSELIVPDDSTVIIGGLRSNDLTYTYEKIPLIGNIPLLGKAFQHRVKSDDQKELLLFVTPRVIYDHPPLDCKEQELHDKIDERMDALETQNEWREAVEAPYELLEKDILYSGVENNPDIYDRILKEKDQLEKVKPYKVSKPKGERRYRVTTEDGVLKEEVLEPEETAEEDVSAATGEVKDFSLIQKEARPGTARSEEEMAPAEMQQPGFPMGGMPMIIPQAPGEGVGDPAGAPEGDKFKEPTDRPGWLRKGARQSSDAGDLSTDGTIQVGKASALEAETKSVKRNPAGNPDEPPSPMALVDEIPFGPIEEELSPLNGTSAPAAPKVTQPEFDPEDPWNLGVEPKINLTAQPSAIPGVVAIPKVPTESNSTSSGKSAGPSPITGGQLGAPAAQTTANRKDSKKPGFVPVVEISAKPGAKSTVHQAAHALPGCVAPPKAALAEAERLQIIAEKAAGLKNKNDLIDKSKILAYNDLQSVPVPETASSPPKELPSR